MIPDILSVSQAILIFLAKIQGTKEQQLVIITVPWQNPWPKQYAVVIISHYWTSG